MEITLNKEALRENILDEIRQDNYFVVNVCSSPAHLSFDGLPQVGILKITGKVVDEEYRQEYEWIDTVLIDICKH